MGGGGGRDEHLWNVLNVWDSMKLFAFKIIQANVFFLYDKFKGTFKAVSKEI